jgi:hypothetical protein
MVQQTAWPRLASHQRQPRNRRSARPSAFPEYCSLGDINARIVGLLARCLCRSTTCHPALAEEGLATSRQETLRTSMRTPPMSRAGSTSRLSRCSAAARFKDRDQASIRTSWDALWHPVHVGVRAGAALQSVRRSLTALPVCCLGGVRPVSAEFIVRSRRDWTHLGSVSSRCQPACFFWRCPSRASGLGVKHRRVARRS